MIRRPPRSTQSRSSAASDVYKRQAVNGNNLVQALVPHEQLTEGLTWVGTALGVGVSIGASVAGGAIDRVGSHGGFLVVIGSAGLALVAALIGLPALRGEADRASERMDDAVAASVG